eukprot:6767786-Prymnesium_polylepis.1
MPHTAPRSSRCPNFWKNADVNRSAGCCMNAINGVHTRSAGSLIQLLPTCRLASVSRRQPAPTGGHMSPSQPRTIGFSLSEMRGTPVMKS